MWCYLFCKCREQYGAFLSILISGFHFVALPIAIRRTESIRYLNAGFTARVFIAIDWDEAQLSKLTGNFVVVIALKLLVEAWKPFFPMYCHAQKKKNRQLPRF